MIKPEDFKSHYDYLDIAWIPFAKAVGIEHANNGIVSCAGDKCYGYQAAFKMANIPFAHGVMVYFLCDFDPWSSEVRSVVKDGQKSWVAPVDWVVENYPKFKKIIKKIEKGL